MVREVAPNFERRGQALYHARWLRLAHRLARPQIELAIVGPEALATRAAFAKTLQPLVTFVGATGPSELDLLQGKHRAGETWIYVCRGGSCQAPTQSVDEALMQIHAIVETD